MLSKTLWLQLSFTITPAWVTACVGAVQLSCRNFRYGLWPASIAVRPRSLAKFSRAPLGRGGAAGGAPLCVWRWGGARQRARRRAAPERATMARRSRAKVRVGTVRQTGSPGVAGSVSLLLLVGFGGG